MMIEDPTVLDLVDGHRRNQRLVREQKARIARHGFGRNAAATEANLQRRGNLLAHIETELITLGERTLASLLHQEHDLRLRIADNRRLGHSRPELASRLKRVRLQLREMF